MSDWFWMIACIIVVGCILYIQIRRIAFMMRAKRHLSQVMVKALSNPATFDEQERMMPRMETATPDYEVLSWADKFIRTAMVDTLTTAEQEAIKEGLQQPQIYGRWNFAREFFGKY